MHPFSDIPSFPKYLNSVFYHRCPLRLASQGYIFLYFLKLLRVLSLRMLVEFSLTCIFQHVWEKCFNLCCSHFQKMHGNKAYLLMVSPPLKTPGIIFGKSVSPTRRKTEGVEEVMICSIKI